MKTTIEVGDVVEPVDGNGKTSRHLFSGGYYYANAVCVSVAPFILISETGDMRWSSKKSENFVSVGKAHPEVLKICMDRLRRDIEEGEVTGVVIDPSQSSTINLEKNKLFQKPIPLEEQKEVWLKAWLAVAGAVGASSSKIATNWADVCLKEYTARFE